MGWRSGLEQSRWSQCPSLHWTDRHGAVNQNLCKPQPRKHWLCAVRQKKQTSVVSLYLRQASIYSTGSWLMDKSSPSEQLSTGRAQCLLHPCRYTTIVTMAGYSGNSSTAGKRWAGVDLGTKDRDCGHQVSRVLKQSRDETVHLSLVFLSAIWAFTIS